MNSAISVFPLDASPQASAAAAAPRRLWVLRVGTALWRALEDAGRARARRQLLDFASRCEANQPELAKELRAASAYHPRAGLL